MKIILDTIESEVQKQDKKIVVRLTTSHFIRSNGSIVQSKTLRFLKNKSIGLNGLLEDAHANGADEAFNSITNINDCADGIYEIIINDVSKDWETGVTDSWNWKLIPYNE